MKIRLSSILILPLFLLIVTPAIAMMGRSDFDGPKDNLSENGEHQKGASRSCQAREDGIKKKMSQLTRLAAVIEGNFDKIATRVKDYYVNKVVPSGKTVSNYDTLVLDIQTKKDAVELALETAQSDVNGFNCDSTDPKVDMSKFKTDMKAVKGALKDYRTAIRNLIVAVKGAVGEDHEATETPTPTVTPTLTPTETPTPTPV